MNRTGTYVAFDGLGEINPAKSDFRYYATLQAWTANKNVEFRFVNSHDKTYAVRDTSSKVTLYARIRQARVLLLVWGTSDIARTCTP